VETSRQWLRGNSGRRRNAGACRRGVQYVVVWESRFGPFGPRTVDSALVVERRNGAAADQVLLLTLYAHCVQASTVFLADTIATEQR
jgi:hypothetical protein